MTTINNIATHATLPIKRMGWLIHVATWCVLLGMPFFFTGRGGETVTVESYLRFLVMPFSFMIVFYINYFLLIRRYLFTRRAGQFFIINLTMIVGVMLSVHIFMQALPEDINRSKRKHEPRWQEAVGFYLGNVMLYSLVAGVSVAIRMTNGWYQVESLRQELERSRAEAELQNLKSQLNPHFLFNTLNNIYSLIAFSPERAQEAVHDLSRLLRYVLYDSSQPYVSLEKELDFIHNYVELMRIRIPEHVELKTDISASQSGTLIAPLLFISLIENAFKHGVSNSKPSFIRICIREDAQNISCDILNSYFPKDATQDKSGSGIGLTNLEKRLNLLYPNLHTFRCEREGSNYHSLLSITINTTGL